jgi:hypothetical protein
LDYKWFCDTLAGVFEKHRGTFDIEEKTADATLTADGGSADGEFVVGAEWMEPYFGYVINAPETLSIPVEGTPCP